MRCGSCGFTGVRKGMDECPECNAPLFRQDRKSQASAHRSGDEIIQESKLQAAKFECRKFGLMPQGEHETIEQFSERIDREKTAVMTARIRHSAPARFQGL